MGEASSMKGEPDPRVRLIAVFGLVLGFLGMIASICLGNDGALTAAAVGIASILGGIVGFSWSRQKRIEEEIKHAFELMGSGTSEEELGHYPLENAGQWRKKDGH